jgi:hypothetical protein
MISFKGKGEILMRAADGELKKICDLEEVSVEETYTASRESIPVGYVSGVPAKNFKAHSRMRGNEESVAAFMEGIAKRIEQTRVARALRKNAEITLYGLRMRLRNMGMNKTVLRTIQAERVRMVRADAQRQLREQKGEAGNGDSCISDVAVGRCTSADQRR